MVNSARKLLKWVLIGGAGLVLLAIGLQLLINQLGDSQINAQKALIQQAPDVEETNLGTKPDGSPVKIVSVAPERVPDTFEERMNAASITLVPNRAGYPDAMELPIATRRQLSAAANNFLRAWETYNLQTSFAAYQNKLRPLTAPGSLNAVANRQDSVDDRGVCIAQDQCTLGSEIYQGAHPEATVVDYDGQNAYLTTFLPIRYVGSTEIDPRAGGVRQRSYGLILTRSGSKWLVSRAAAETLDRSTPTEEIGEDVNPVAAMGPGANR